MNRGWIPVAGPILLSVLLLLFWPPVEAAAEDLMPSIREAVDQKKYGRAETLLRRMLQDHPGRHPARFLYARVLSWQNKYTPALEQYELLLNDQPQNVDYLLGKAQVLRWDGRSREALPILRRARSLNPNYPELYREELRSLKAAGQLAYYRQLRARAQLRFPSEEFPPAPSPPRRNEVELRSGIENLTNGRENWSHSELFLRHQFDPSTFARLEARSTRRFDETDQEILVGGSMRLLPNLQGSGIVATSPSPDILPEYTTRLRLSYHLPGSWRLQGGYRYRDYPRSEVETFPLGVVCYRDRFRTAYTFLRSRLDGSTYASTHLFQIGYHGSDGHRATLHYAVGEDIEATGPNQVLRTDIESLTLTGRYWFGERWGLGLKLLWHEQGDLYTRSGASLGLRHRF